MSLKDKTINGLIWSSIDNFSRQGITLVVGIILARLISPREFGLIGMLTIFIAISNSFINSGFSQALIQKKKCSQVDYSTVFYFNLVIGIISFLVLYIAAPFISNFYNELQLTSLVRVLGIVLIIDSLSIIQRTTLTKRIDFKLQTRISIISSLISGAISIVMAYSGWGVWSLVYKTIIGQGINTALLWLWNRWKPLFVFSRHSFSELFNFGNKLLLSGLLDTAYKNIYYLVIGKLYSAAELGYFTRADMFKNLPSQNLSLVISRVSYPVLSSVQNNKEQLRAVYKKLITSSMLISFTSMMGMAAIAEPLIITLIGEQWRPSIVYLQMLCFVGMLYPLYALNLNILNVKGRSDLFLKIEIIKKILAVPTIVLGCIFGIKILILGMIINSLIAFFLNSRWSGKLINYSMKEQVKDIIPSFMLSIAMGIVVMGVGYVLTVNYFHRLIIEVVIGFLFVFGMSEMTKLDAYLFMKKTLKEKLAW